MIKKGGVNMPLEVEELVYNDPTTMERVVKIVNGLWNGTVNIIKSPNDGCLACQIGEYWFYFIGSEDENLKIEEFKNSYDVFTIAQMILEAIVELEDDNEYAYYTELLNF